MTWDIAAFTAPDPGRPPTPVVVDWSAVEQWLGLSLPDDYKYMAGTYGPLDFGDYLWIHVPCIQEDRGFDYGEWLRRTHRQTRIDIRALPKYERPAVHPEAGGLLAWGTSRSSDTLFWDTSVSEDPNQWTVIRQVGAVPSRGRRPLLRYDHTLTGYLQHVTRSEWEFPSSAGTPSGALSGTVARTAFLQTAQPWTPPVPVTSPLTDTERRIALQTGTGVTALRLLSPPPESPYLGNRDWKDLFDDLGTRLPHEYVTLMELYGAGCWSGWLRFHTPLRADKLSSFTGHIDYFREAYSSLKETFPEDFPLTVWPEPGGFLPFGNSIDGDHFGWLTEEDDPDSWPMIISPRHSDQGPPLEISLIDMLLGWQRGTFAHETLPELDEDDDPVEFAGFEPWDDKSHW